MQKVVVGGVKQVTFRKGEREKGASQFVDIFFFCFSLPR